VDGRARPRPQIASSGIRLSFRAPKRRGVGLIRRPREESRSLAPSAILNPESRAPSLPLPEHSLEDLHRIFHRFQFVILQHLQMTREIFNSSFAAAL
jgi:hypothetical protein